MDDTKALISLYVEDNKWDDAFLLLHAHPGRGERPMKGQATVGINALSSLYPPPLPPPPPSECKADVYLPYAKHLALSDRFDEARVAYLQGGYPELATRILEQLTHNGVVENRFADASFCFFQLAMEALKEIKSPPHAMSLGDRKLLERFSELYDKVRGGERGAPAGGMGAASHPSSRVASGPHILPT